MPKGSAKPALRFKGFTDAWEQRKLEDFVEFFNGLTYSPKDIRQTGTLVLRSSNIKNDEIIDADNVYVDSSIVNSENVMDGDIIVVVRNGSRALIGKHAKVKGDRPNTVIGAFMTGIRSKHSSFVNALLNTSSFDENVGLNMGATINQITGYMFSEMEFFIPSPEEQEAIGGYFERLDTLITLHQRKCSKLLEVKKSMLERMFPKDGANVAEVRFKRFTEAWDKRKVEEITTSYSGGTPTVGVKMYYGGTIPFIRSAEINCDSTELFITEEGLKNSSAKLVSVGDILYALYGATGGEVGRAKLNGAINQAILAVKPMVNYDAEFISQWLRKNKQNIVESYLQGGQGNLSGEIVRGLVVDLPSYDEQIVIGKYFRCLDTLITLYQHKLEKLKNIKKACLEKMFA